ncbi:MULTISPECIES: hypothetical protein [Kordiimonas]|uniref:hypothetical protein n=1 Tax=Kordiimonas TaxID=288021 RepID=UPI00257C5404|nr:hypothetical protein [Kordiimonas sp. UBA4487]
MSGQDFVLAIIFGSFIFAGVMHWMKIKADAVKAKAAGLDGDARAEIAALKKRVDVLERIVTDRSTRLKEEIDAL